MSRSRFAVLAVFASLVTSMPALAAAPGAVGFVESGLEGEQAIEAVAGLALGVGAVQLDVAERSFGLLAFFLQHSAELGLATA